MTTTKSDPSREKRGLGACNRVDPLVVMNTVLWWGLPHRGGSVCVGAGGIWELLHT